jgi:hypothetical protein
MKKKILVLLIGILLIAINLYAEPGDVFVEGKLGVGTTTPNARLEVNGDIKIGDTSDICDAGEEGTIRFAGTDFSAVWEENGKV